MFVHKKLKTLYFIHGQNIFITFKYKTMIQLNCAITDREPLNKNILFQPTSNGLKVVTDPCHYFSAYADLKLKSMWD